jgi:hypothetical protein
MTWAGFEPTIPGSQQPQTYALDRAATGTGGNKYINTYKYIRVQRRGSGAQETGTVSLFSSHT